MCDIFKENDIFLPQYNDVNVYIKNIDIGHITKLHENNTCENCMGYGTDPKQTLQKIVETELLFDKFNYLNVDQQFILKEFLMQKDPVLYANFDHTAKTIFLRETADITELLNSPNGSFVSTLWCRRVEENF